MEISGYHIEPWLVGIGAVLAVGVALIIAALLWEAGRSIYIEYTGKKLGLTDEEIWQREAAKRLQEDVQRDKRISERHAIAAANFDRRRIGVLIATFAVGRSPTI
jgi:hypothetical protein